MTNFAAKIAGVATLALAALPVAALPVAALTTVAHAATAPQVVRISDLDLSTRAGMDAFNARVQTAGRKLCRDETKLARLGACEAGVRAEAHEKLAQALSNSRSAPTALAAR